LNSAEIKILIQKIPNPCNGNLAQGLFHDNSPSYAFIWSDLEIQMTVIIDLDSNPIYLIDLFLLSPFSIAIMISYLIAFSCE
jgi:hypothetical protein